MAAEAHGTAWRWNPRGHVTRLEFEARFVEDYLAWMNGLVVQHPDSLDWLLASPINRNQKASGLLDACFMLALLRAGLEEDLVELPATIVVDDPSLAWVAAEYIASRRARLRVVVRGQPLSRLRLTLRPLATRLRFAWRHLAARWSGRPRPLPAEPFVLVDLFTELHAPDGELERSYYPGMLAPLSDAERSRVVFLAHPFQVPLPHFFGHCRGLRRNARQSLLREDWLNTDDYRHALGHARRLRALPWRAEPFRGFDLTGVIRRDMERNEWDPSAISALLTERLFHRLAAAGVKLARVVDWFENQRIDRGLNHGMRAAYPGTKVVGYEGYVVPRNLLHVYPMPSEAAADIIPGEVTVVGRALVEPLQERCPGLAVSAAPAFRYARASWPKRPAPDDTKPRTVLIALPYYLDDALMTLAAAEELLELAPACRVLLKAHPRTPAERLAKLRGRPLARGLEIAAGSVEDLLRDADVLVTSTSTIAFEALAFGVPVAVYADPSRLSQCPIPDRVPRDVWSLCFSGEELRSAVRAFVANYREVWRRCAEVQSSIQADYFEPVTRDGVRRLLGFDER